MHVDPLAVLAAETIGAVLGRQIVAVGAGRVSLDEVDRRLAGLQVRLNAFRVADAPPALVLTGLVGAAGPPPSDAA